MTEQNVNTEERENRIRGMVYGLALGDALGYPVEFENAPAVTGISGTLIISDDTQMSLHNVAALQQIVRAYGHKLRSPRLDTGFHNAARRAFLDEYVLFGTSEYNNRAPGNACMSSINNYRKNPAIALTGKEPAYGNDSKGNGTIMRSGWLGALPFDRETTTVLSILQSETTHEHMLAAVSAAFFTNLTHRILSGQLVRREQIFTAATIICGELQNLVEGTPFAYLQPGIMLVQQAVNNIELSWADLICALQGGRNPNAFFGEGWVAEEALFNVLGVFSAFRSPKDGILALVNTPGDSDTIAAIGGCLYGAFWGYETLCTAFDRDIEQELEPLYQPALAEAAHLLNAGAQTLAAADTLSIP